jgi:DNA-binding transcriptional LysR family regulator
MIETSQFQTLVAVAKASSFSRAAEDLCVTQSAISQSIKNLENKIGVKLFRRSGKRVVLTPEGEKLHSLASEFLHGMGRTLDEIRYDKDGMSGKVRVGCLTGIGKSLIAPELQKMVVDHPDLVMSLTFGFQEELIREFEDYKLDIAILPEGDLPSVGEKVFFTEERSTLVFPSSNKFQINENITLEELTALPTIFFEHNHSVYLRWCQQRFGRIPKNVNVRYVVNSHTHMLDCVKKDLGIAVMPTHILERSGIDENVSAASKEFEVNNGKFFIVYHKDSEELLRIRETIRRILNSDNPYIVRS